MYRPQKKEGVCDFSSQKGWQLPWLPERGSLRLCARRRTTEFVMKVFYSTSGDRYEREEEA